METKLENLFIICYGLSGGFGGANNYGVVEAENIEEAEKKAYESCVEEYERYSGSNGLRSVEEIMEEDGEIDEDEANEIYREEREGWFDYSAEPYSKELEEKAMMHHYHNPYKDITDNI